MNTYIVVGSRPWNRTVFNDTIGGFPGSWRFISDRGELTGENLRALSPRYIFFLHWSWIVPTEIVDEFECVCFHMADVPYGRGGSPLQNLIERGHRFTVLTALRMTRELDAGPVYRKEPLSLEGSAEEILLRSSRQSARMILQLIAEEPEPQPQTGTPVVFRRRKPAESELPTCGPLEGVHDHIRMLDADGYPKAFLVHGGFRYEFSRAALYDRRVMADVTITPV